MSSSLGTRYRSIITQPQGACPDDHKHAATQSGFIEQNLVEIGDPRITALSDQALIVGAKSGLLDQVRPASIPAALLILFVGVVRIPGVIAMPFRRPPNVPSVGTIRAYRSFPNHFDELIISTRCCPPRSALYGRRGRESCRRATGECAKSRLFPGQAPNASVMPIADELGLQKSRFMQRRTQRRSGIRMRR